MKGLKSFVFRVLGGTSFLLRGLDVTLLDVGFLLFLSLASLLPKASDLRGEPEC